MTDVYKRLAKKLDDLPNGFPSTESEVELKILQKIFTPEDAELALKIRPIPETAAQIGERLGKSADEMEMLLDKMVKKGQIGSARMNDQQVFIFFPFVFGIWEFQQPRLDKELAELMEDYGPALMGKLGHYAPAVMRVVPVNIQIDAKHQVRPYEDLLLTLEKASRSTHGLYLQEGEGSSGRALQASHGSMYGVCQSRGSVRQVSFGQGHIQRGSPRRNQEIR